VDKVTTDGLPTGSERERETRTEYLARKMGELADATRKAAKLLPDRPITGEVVACAGIMAMANLLDEVRAALAGSVEREPEVSMALTSLYDVATELRDEGDECRAAALYMAWGSLHRAALAASPPEASREPRKTWPLTGEPEWHAEDCPCFADHPDMGNHGDCTCGYQPVPPVEPEGSTSPASNVSASSSA